MSHSHVTLIALFVSIYLFTYCDLSSIIIIIIFSSLSMDVWIVTAIKHWLGDRCNCRICK